MVRTEDYLKKWEKARPIYPKDHIISSDFGTKGKNCHFHPSYNCERKSDMNKLITMEYARVWKMEKEIWDNKNYRVDKKEERQKAWQKKFEEENTKWQRKVKALKLKIASVGGRVNKIN